MKTPHQRIRHDPSIWYKDAYLVAVPKTPEHDAFAHQRRPGWTASRRQRETKRLCAVHRIERPTDELLRFVATPDNDIAVDLKHNLPGRGVWVSADKASVLRAIDQGVFPRGLKQKVTVRPGLADEVATLMERRLLDTLSLATKAGAIVTGFTKTHIAIEKGRVCILLHGADAASDGCDKLSRKFLAGAEESGQTRQIVAILTTSQLSLAIGRSNVVHAGLTETGMAGVFLAQADRLTRYCQGKAEPNTKPQAPIGNE